MIKIVGPQLTQWDTGRQVIADILVDSGVVAPNVAHVHFANQGDARAVIMDIENGQAKIPDYLLQTGKSLCVYLVLDGVTQESKTFHVTKRERPENYVYEEDQRNYIYELITGAENAIESANIAGLDAARAAINANVATESATEASKNANDAANSATLAADNANKAATKAAHTAKSLMVVGEAKGEVIALDDAIDQFLVGCRIFGKTTQDGTPTPDAPVELVSVGDSGSITVDVAGEHDAQSMSVATPNGLPGIPVTSGGNYTDANGQRWICDEIDFARGVYVQRCKEIVIDGTTAVRLNKHANSQCLCAQAVPDILITSPPNIQKLVMSDRYEAYSWTDQNNRVYCIGEDIIITDNRFTNMDATIAVLRAERPKVAYILATPIETPLSEEELAAYASLHTYRDHTTVSNDASAHMELEYVMDAKKYIDSLVTGTIVPARVE